MRSRTTIELDMDLVQEAGALLGTSRIVDTVHAALEDVIRSRRRGALVDLRPALTLDSLDAMRSHRFAPVSAPHATEPD